MNTDNPYINHFRREVEILEDQLEDGDELLIADFKEAIEGVLEVFATQGHSGGSAPYGARAVAKAIENTMLFKPLSPITGADNEWNVISDGTLGRAVYQNNRSSDVFKEGKDSQPYYLDAIVWQGEEEHDRFTGTVLGISSRQYVRLPFNPKTFYIDVVKVYYGGEGKPPEEVDYYEENKTDGIKRYYQYSIKDQNQLKEVWEYYDQFTPTRKE